MHKKGPPATCLNTTDCVFHPICRLLFVFCGLVRLLPLLYLHLVSWYPSAATIESASCVASLCACLASAFVMALRLASRGEESNSTENMEIFTFQPKTHFPPCPAPKRNIREQQPRASSSPSLLLPILMMQLFDNVCTPIDTDVKMAIDPLDKPIDTPILSISTEIGGKKK